MMEDGVMWHRSRGSHKNATTRALRGQARRVRLQSLALRGPPRQEPRSRLSQRPLAITALEDRIEASRLPAVTGSLVQALARDGEFCCGPNTICPTRGRRFTVAFLMYGRMGDDKAGSRIDRCRQRWGRQDDDFSHTARLLRPPSGAGTRI